MNTRNFRVRGHINALYTSGAGIAQSKNISNIKVELWHKAVGTVIFLGSAMTTADGQFVIDFSAKSPTVMIESGKIKEVFIRVLYGGKVIIGDLPPEGGSFD